MENQSPLKGGSLFKNTERCNPQSFQLRLTPVVFRIF